MRGRPKKQLPPPPDQLMTIDKSVLTDFVGALSVAKMRQLRSALRIALDLA